MNNNRKFTEEQLQLSWCQSKSSTSIFTVTGVPVAVNSPGTWNLEAGPDFLNAKLAIGDHELTGSVEIHKKTSDWIHHGHFNDSLYNNVILHVVAEDNTETLSGESKKRLPDAPVIVMNPKFRAKRIAPADKFPKGKCHTFFSSMEDPELNLFFRKAGLNRFNSKTYYILSNMRDKGINKAFTELIFDACGYKQNRQNFLELFARISRYENLSPKETEAVIWGESGLLPDPVSTKLDGKMERFVKGLWEVWWQIRKEPLPSIKWKRAGLRPMNFPERRVAAVTMLISKMGRFPLMFFANSAQASSTPAAFIKTIIQTLKCSHPVWDEYINFTSQCATSASVLGKSRAADIAVNVVLPALKAQMLLAENPSDNSETLLQNNIAEQAFLTMSSIQSNRILETASLKWFMPPGRKRRIVKDAVSQQGVLNIYRNFCENVCMECKLCPLAHLMSK